MSGVIYSNVGDESANQPFQNTEIEYKFSWSNFLKIIQAQFKEKGEQTVPKQPIPVQPLSQSDLLAEQDDAIYRLGHSTLLIRIDGEYVLIDPVFSERASPVQWAGPKRFHQSPISIEQLPEIKAVIISHDHYDHLDKGSIEQLKEKVEHFVTPLKVGNYLEKWGVDSAKIIELSWWQEVNFNNITLVATPAQHFSGRGLFDKDQTLWASWVIKGQQTNLFYSGDTGYFSGFKEIGEKYGPFDVTMIETGAYNRLWQEIHMSPEESLQAHIDLKGKAMLPVHNSTFDLALHDWFEPLERVNDLAWEHSVNLLTPTFGEKINVSEPKSQARWWQPLMPQQQQSALARQVSY